MGLRAHIDNSVEAWADAARRHKYRQDFVYQRTIDTFQNVLECKTAANTAAATISSLYEPLIKRDPHSSPVGPVWAILCDAVRTLGGNNDLTQRLVDLLISISELPDVTDDHGNPIFAEWQSRGGYWRILPGFGWIFKEHAMDIDNKEEMEDDWDSQAIPLLNATTFAAVYLNRRKDSVGTLYYAIHSLTAGVEEPYQTPDQYRDAAMYVPPAVTWILLAGKWIYELCTRDMNCEDGASLQQWALWKKRFGEIAKTQGLQGEIKDLAWRAAFKMGEIERQIE